MYIMKKTCANTVAQNIGIYTISQLVYTVGPYIEMLIYDIKGEGLHATQT